MTKAIPSPRIHSLVVPIQPCGSGTPSSVAPATTGSRKTRTVARAAVFTALLAAWIVLEPLDLYVLGLLLVLLRQSSHLPRSLSSSGVNPSFLGTATVWQYWQF